MNILIPLALDRLKALGLYILYSEITESNNVQNANPRNNRFYNCSYKLCPHYGLCGPLPILQDVLVQP